MTEKRIPCEVYSRIVGYYRPIRKWNAGKQQEYKERITYKLDEKSESEDTNGKVLGVV
jgi:glucan biosynthesis protein